MDQDRRFLETNRDPTIPPLMEPEGLDEYRAGFVAIVGKPNVGKSTLMNALIKQKLSIVTPKPQTTRQRILGILTTARYQVGFVDTPGILEPSYKLQEVMLRTAIQTIENADVVLLLLDGMRYGSDLDQETLRLLKRVDVPVVLAINKIDRIKKHLILAVISDVQHKYPFADIYPISAMLSDGLDELLETLAYLLPKGPPLYPQDMLTEHPERFFVEELVREQIFKELREEVPYSIAVQVDQFTQSKNKLYIRANIFVEKDSQKAIVIGKKGQMLKAISKMAREEIEQFLQKSIYLDLWVKVRRKWRKSENDLQEFGYH